MTASFRTGPDINPFSAGARDGLKLLESITPVEMASAVPRIVIRKIDFKTGKPDDSVRPLMYDLVETPQFSAIGDDLTFGVDREQFMERALVSLTSLDVKTELQYGDDALRQVTLKFVVHHPAIVFDRDSQIPWREILEENKSFSLEYGWIADPTVCQNPLYNGFGFDTDQGIVIQSTHTVLLIVSKFNTTLRQSGEVEVTVTAYENGDIALRETKFADVAGANLAIAGPPDPNGNGPKISDDDAAKFLFTKFKSITPQISIGKGKFYRMIDLLNNLLAPMMEEAVKKFGYKGSPPLELTLANFNMNAPRQSVAWGSSHMGGVTSIGDFLVPADRLLEEFSKHLASGSAMLLRSFISHIIKFINSDEAWARVVGEQLRPNIGIKYNTIVRTNGGYGLVVTILDRNAIGDNVKKLKALPLNKQSKAEVMQVLDDSDVPVLEFSRAGSVLLDASFEIQTDPLLQSIQIETAEAGRKDRVQKNKMPDVDSRKGQSRPKDIVSVSVLEGEITMFGNFVLGPFDRLWVEFFGSSQISGIFNILEKNDHLEQGKFTSTFKLISESIDPLNTRKRFSEQELTQQQDAAKKLKSRK